MPCQVRAPVEALSTLPADSGVQASPLWPQQPLQGAWSPHREPGGLLVWPSRAGMGCGRRGWEPVGKGKDRGLGPLDTCLIPSAPAPVPLSLPIPTCSVPMTPALSNWHLLQALCPILVPLVPSSFCSFSILFSPFPFLFHTVHPICTFSIPTVLFPSSFPPSPGPLPFYPSSLPLPFPSLSTPSPLPLLHPF